MCAKLSRHIQTVHKNNDRVKKAMKMKRTLRTEEFKKMRREGIEIYNIEEAGKENPCYQEERKRSKHIKLIKCSSCTGFFSKRFFSKHRKYCFIKTDSMPFGITFESASPKHLKLPEDFVNKILPKLRNDEIGALCRSDENLLLFGKHLYARQAHKTEKKTTIYKAVKSNMRALANLYIHFTLLDDVVKKHGNLLDMFTVDNYDNLCDAIDTLTISADKTYKAGLRLNLFYLLKKAIKALSGYYYLKRNKEVCEELRKFTCCYDSLEEIIASSARYHLEQTKLLKTRKPCQLPLEEDMKILHNHINDRMRQLCDDFEFEYPPAQFRELRNVTMTRLTLLNGRRGGETARFLIRQWQEAQSDGWIDAQRIKQLPEPDKLLVKANKMAYMSGKGNKHVVSLIIPADSVPAMVKLADPTFRKAAGVAPDNSFLFASTQLSDLNYSGWHALKDTCQALPLANIKLLNATNNRHRVSTLYASLDIPECEREHFYTHMGHSAQINKNVYQTPLAVAGITKVGKNLLEIDAGQ